MKKTIFNFIIGFVLRFVLTHLAISITIFSITEIFYKHSEISGLSGFLFLLIIAGYYSIPMTVAFYGASLITKKMLLMTHILIVTCISIATIELTPGGLFEHMIYLAIYPFLYATILRKISQTRAG